jgi:transposase-like protein
MNVLPAEKVARLKEALESGLSRRKAAKAVGINRGTVSRWAKLIVWQSRPKGEKTVTVRLSSGARQRFKSEGAKMRLGTAAFAGLILETVAEEDFFGAILD